MRSIPPSVRDDVIRELRRQAASVGYDEMNVIQRSELYRLWAQHPDIGQKLAQYRDPAGVHTYIKDTLMKKIARAAMSDASPYLSAIGISEEPVWRYERPHTVALSDGRVISWGKADDWKTVVPAVLERVALLERTHGGKFRPYAAILLPPLTRFQAAGTRSVVESVANKLGLELGVHWYVPDEGEPLNEGDRIYEEADAEFNKEPSFPNLLAQTRHSQISVFSQDSEEDLEGSEEDHAAGWGEQYPLDSVFVRTENRNVGDVVRRINAGRYELVPEFQRGFVWSPEKQSRLIESCLMRIPLPVIYVAEGIDGRIIVVDGLQRLTSLAKYVNNEFSLTGLGSGSIANTLNGKKFSDLPINLQERIEDTQLTLYILDPKAPERARLDIFERVNGGVPLTRQQMRNSLYNGPATRWLKQAAESSEFKLATGGTLSSAKMRDREAVNRFCAFRLLGVVAYGGDMDAFLGQALLAMNRMSDERLSELREAFGRAMKINHMLFREHAFRRSLANAPGVAGRSVINIALFDVSTVLLSELQVEVAKSHADKLISAFRSLLADSNFVDSITYSTNSARQVERRFSMLNDAINEALA